MTMVDTGDGKTNSQKKTTAASSSLDVACTSLKVLKEQIEAGVVSPDDLMSIAQSSFELYQEVRKDQIESGESTQNEEGETLMHAYTAKIKELSSAFD